MLKIRSAHKRLVNLQKSHYCTKPNKKTSDIRMMSAEREGKVSVHLREEKTRKMKLHAVFAIFLKYTGTTFYGELVSGKWLGLTKVTFQDPTGKERTWEALRRMTKRPDAPADAVIVIPILKRSLHYDCYILVKQYRPPSKGYTLEFPAGLLDGNESVENCALRELKEETGYTGVAKFTSPVIGLDPGTANTTGQIVTVEIDGDLSENQNPTAQPEFIEVLTVPKDDFLKILNDYSGKGVKVDARLYMYAVALEQTKKT